jgi:hypothetical protein
LPGLHLPAHRICACMTALLMDSSHYWREDQMFWIFSDGPEYFRATWDSRDGRERRGKQPGHLSRRWRVRFMQPG